MTPPYDITALIKSTSQEEASSLAFWALKETQAFTFLTLFDTDDFKNDHRKISKIFRENILKGTYNLWFQEALSLVSELSFMDENDMKEIYSYAINRESPQKIINIFKNHIPQIIKSCVEDGELGDRHTITTTSSCLTNQQKKKVEEEIELSFALAGEYGHEEIVSAVAAAFPDLLEKRVDTISNMFDREKKSIIEASLNLKLPVDPNFIRKSDFPKLYQTIFFSVIDIQMKVLKTYTPYLNENQIAKLASSGGAFPDFPEKLRTLSLRNEIKSAINANPSPPKPTQGKKM